jgi:hypothetical protein
VSGRTEERQLLAISFQLTVLFSAALAAVKGRFERLPGNEHMLIADS